jgi:hypothetical protein
MLVVWYTLYLRAPYDIVVRVLRLISPLQYAPSVPMIVNDHNFQSDATYIGPKYIHTWLSRNGVVVIAGDCSFVRFIPRSAVQIRFATSFFVGIASICNLMHVNIYWTLVVQKHRGFDSLWRILRRFPTYVFISAICYFTFLIDFRMNVRSLAVRIALPAAFWPFTLVAPFSRVLIREISAY